MTVASEEGIGVDHDQRFKVLIREFFREFVRLFFPEWAPWFDYDRAEWLMQEVYLDPPTGDRRELDLVVKLPATRPIRIFPKEAPSAGPWLVLIHLDIESGEAVATFHGRQYDYYRLLRHRHLLPVLPIGLFLRVGFKGLGWQTYEEWFETHRLVHFRYPYVGLPGLKAATYRDGDNWLGVALSVLMRVPESQKAKLKADALQRLATCPETAARRYLLCECVEAYLPLHGPQLAKYERLLLTEPYREARMVGLTSYEKGQRDTLLLQLEDKFGPLSKSIRDRIMTLSASQVTEAIHRILRATTLRELELED
jgi:hypothetical protein